MEIWIDNRQNRHNLALNRMHQKATAILNALDSPDGELSLVIVDDTQIAKLNEHYLQRQGPTNVIAFPMQEGEFAGVTPTLLGDVVISVDTCAREAQSAGIPFEYRLDELLIHGILHLFGYDHVHSVTKATIMAEKTRELMTVIGPMQGQGESER